MIVLQDGLSLFVSKDNKTLIIRNYTAGSVIRIKYQSNLKN